MSWYHRLLNVARTQRLNREIERELSFHVTELAESLRSQGYAPEAAEREARRRLGSAALHHERTRDADVVRWLDALLRDARQAVRGLVRAPLFAAVAVLSLALAIGGNTAIFTLLDALVLRPLPVPAPEQLVTIEQAGSGVPTSSFTNPLWEALRDRPVGTTAMAAFSDTRFNTAVGGEPRMLAGAYVSGDFFRLFGVSAALGRVFTAQEDVRGCAPIAVLGHDYWRTSVGGDNAVLGRTLRLEGVQFEIVGVTEASFSGPIVGARQQVYVPLCAEAAIRGERSGLDARSRWWLTVMARRDAAVSLEQLNARLSALGPAVFTATLPEHYGAEQRADYLASSFQATSAPAGISALRSRYSAALMILMGGVGLVLLIACANVANLLLARSAARQREFAIRAAIGAGRGRLVRQLATESLLLAGLGAVVGLVLARLGAAALVALIATEPGAIALDLSLNARVLAFSVGVALFTALLFGLVPAWRAGRADPQSTMAAHGRSIAEGHARFTMGKVLVAAQVALSLVLLVGAGLLVGSFRNLTTMDAGFETDGVLIARIDARTAGVEPEPLLRGTRELVARLRTLPGVRSAASASITPLGRAMWNDRLVVDGYTPSDDRDGTVYFNEVSAGYFTALRSRLIAGRDFEPADASAAAPVAIINESVARKFFGTAAPLGETYRTQLGDTLSAPVTVIGVVEDAKYGSLREESSGTIYLAQAQATGPDPFVSFVIQADGDPGALVPAVRRLVGEWHPAISVQFATLEDQVAGSLQRERVLAVLSALFGVVAFALAVLGLYGVTSYSVTRRRNEIGVRVALGADRGRVVRMVVLDVTRVLILGLLVGVGAARALGRFVASFLFGLSAVEPGVIASAAALLALVALAAGAVPAWRAARMDPTLALRED